MRALIRSKSNSKYSYLVYNPWVNIAFPCSMQDKSKHLLAWVLLSLPSKSMFQAFAYQQTVWVTANTSWPSYYEQTLGINPTFLNPKSWTADPSLLPFRTLKIQSLEALQTLGLQVRYGLLISLKISNPSTVTDPFKSSYMPEKHALKPLPFLQYIRIHYYQYSCYW